MLKIWKAVPVAEITVAVSIFTHRLLYYLVSLEKLKIK